MAQAAAIETQLKLFLHKTFIDRHFHSALNGAGWSWHRPLYVVRYNLNDNRYHVLNGEG